VPNLTLVLGGARSGKSRHAESLFGPGPRTYIATAQAFDDEMRDRIAAHRADRASAGWLTIEEPLELARALLVTDGSPVLVDCLTLWLSNLMLADREIAPAVTALEAALAGRTARAVLVSNEVGLGIVPDNALARRFRDEAGRLHQRLAAQADTVTLVVAGLPMRVK
jgi:adenosylcobinamide kinase/adenosylcobinamide-phosphate guanylyltransferase